MSLANSHIRQTTIGATPRVAGFVRIPCVKALEKSIGDRQNAESMTDTAPNDEYSKNAPDDLAPGSPDRPPRALLRRADQLGVAVLALFALISIGGYWLSQAVIRGRAIDIEKAPPLDPGFGVDLNSADWSGATTLYVGTAFSSL